MDTVKTISTSLDLCRAQAHSIGAWMDEDVQIGRRGGGAHTRYTLRLSGDTRGPLLSPWIVIETIPAPDKGRNRHDRDQTLKTLNGNVR